jgi:NAD(P)H-flavin reductase
MSAPATATPAQPPMLPSVVRVREYRRETHDTYTITLDPPGGWSYKPGQFNMLYAFGVGEAPISMSGDASDTGSIVHTIRAVGSVTNAMDRFKPGASVGIRGPFGSAWPIEEARGHDVVLVSGGIGLAPLRPVIYHILRHRGDYGKVVLLQGARSPADMLFAEELNAWSRRGDIQVLVTVDHAEDSWQGRVGVVTTLFPPADFDPAHAIGMMCGPEIMMRYSIREFEKRGVPHDRLYVSMERNMHCAVGFCGHCQFGPSFVCMDGPVFRYDRIERFFNLPEA